MKRAVRFGVVVVAAAFLLALPAAAGRAVVPALTAVVGTNDGFDISLNDASRKRVSQLVPGTYTVVVQDRRCAS